MQARGTSMTCYRVGTRRLTIHGSYKPRMSTILSPQRRGRGSMLESALCFGLAELVWSPETRQARRRYAAKSETKAIYILMKSDHSERQWQQRDQRPMRPPRKTPASSVRLASRRGPTCATEANSLRKRNTRRRRRAVTAP